jgi:predicted aspartyl protease
VWVDAVLENLFIVVRALFRQRGVMELGARFGVIEVMGEETLARILVLDYEDVVLIGIRVLEQLGLEVDSTTGRLKETKIYLL